MLDHFRRELEWIHCIGIVIAQSTRTDFDVARGLLVNMGVPIREETRRISDVFC
jgi:hypothetical protein